jgi:hypothetical protein
MGGLLTIERMSNLLLLLLISLACSGRPEASRGQFVEQMLKLSSSLCVTKFIHDFGHMVLCCLSWT